jgi:queuine tRNA-ribosyltransferase
MADKKNITESDKLIMFKLIEKDEKTNARAGELQTKKSLIQTPVFMPVGTRASVKTLSSEDLKQIGFNIILSNTYHLCLRPGIDIIKKFKGLHKFMNWDRGILTDSGGFQVFSLSDLRKINEDGVVFRSHIDGAKYEFTPENVLDMQKDLGVDIAMVLDECIPYPSDKSYAKTSTDLTINWAEKSKKHIESKKEYPYVFPIVQGGMFEDLRRICAKKLVNIDFPGYAIGGLSVGEQSDIMYDMIEVSTDELPTDKPRYLMGVGEPVDILNAVERGIDMFDCVMPTRNARNGCLFTSKGKLNIKKAQYIGSEKPLDDKCNCFVCKNYSSGYLNHLFRSGELLGLRLNTYHNLSFFYNLMKNIRSAIMEKKFIEFKKEFLETYLSEQ